MARTFVMGDIHGSYKALLQCLERSGFDKKEDTLIQLGDIADGWSQVYECVDELLSIDNLVCLKGNHDCLDSETELFTKRGWLKYKQILITDLVLGIDLDGYTNWQKINDIIHKESNHLNYYKNNRTDMAITDGHRILFKKNDSFLYKKVKDLEFKDRLKIPLGNPTNQKQVNIISDEYIKLVAWILTDGSIDNNGYITIYQSKENSVLNIEKLLQDLNLEFDHAIRNRDFSELVIKGRKIKSFKAQHEFKLTAKSSKIIIDTYISNKKEVPRYIYDLSLDQLNLFLDTLIEADGSWYDLNNAILYKSIDFLSQVQPLFIMAGYSANISKDNRGDYRLNISKQNTSQIRQDVNKINRVEGTFETWCLNVPFSNFLVRRSGKAYFTGNCWFHEWIMTGVHPQKWKQGGDGTLKSYCNILGKNIQVTSDGLLTDLNPADLPEIHRRFFYLQALKYIDDENRCFVHGGFNRHVPIKDQEPWILYWDRDLWYSALSFAATIRGDKNTATPRSIKTVDGFKEIYIGHTATTAWGKDTPMQAGNIWNLDTGAGFKGRLTIMDIDTKEYWQSDSVQELYKDEKGRN